MGIFKLAVICGGPSQERGISLNSARSVMDHLKGPHLEIIPLYVDGRKQFYRISQAQLYSNTPADFDFKLNRLATFLDYSALIQLLKSVDLVFPVIHGAFGEDGELQAILEECGVPFVGNSSACCKWMFRKHQAAETLRGNGFFTLPHVLFSHPQTDHLPQITRFFQQFALKRAIVKPVVGGSSLDVYSVTTPQEAMNRIHEILTKQSDQQVLLEPFCEGREFTIVVFENLQGEPVALVPTEIDLSYEDNQIFDYRKKYLPTNQAAYHTPPHFSHEIVERLRMQAEQLFKLFGMRDFVRLDGWVMKDGSLYFSDINPVSGLEQNSFLFRQASILGMTHREALGYILKHTCRRYGLTFPLEKAVQTTPKLPVYILFGSHNAERQVSLMSGTNVWLKLGQSDQHAPTPFFLDHQGNIWELPYSYTLNHTVEEIYANCTAPKERIDGWHRLLENIRGRLGIESPCDYQPQEMSLNYFLKRAQKDKAFVFIAMHGGEGENGTLQRNLEAYQIPFNGSSAEASALCMDKYLTGQAIERAGDFDILTLPKKVVSLSSFADYQIAELEDLWLSWRKELSSSQLIVKPRCDGCSAGIVLLQSAQDLQRYLHFLRQKAPFIPSYSFANQSAPVEMPSSLNGEFLLESYIETDTLMILGKDLHHVAKEGWFELTVGVLEHDGVYHALNPSITVAEGPVLSLEEKFQGGTGVNLTPPPEEIFPLIMTQKIKRLVEKAAGLLGIQNYARLDIFFNRVSEKMILIEANTLPGLTPSTVIYHQGLAEEPSLTPVELLDRIISSKCVGSGGRGTIG